MSSIGSRFLGDLSLAVSSIKACTEPADRLSLEIAELSLKLARVAVSRPSTAIPDPLSKATNCLLSELELDRLKGVSGDPLGFDGERPMPGTHVGMRAIKCQLRSSSSDKC